MKTTDTAISSVYTLLSGMNKPLYKLEKPAKNVHTEYIVVNSLPINSGVLQKCYVNVNYHVKDLSPGIPNMTLLESATASLMVILTSNSSSGILIDFESQEYIKEESLNEHYSNIKVSVKIINT